MEETITITKELADVLILTIERYSWIKAMDAAARIYNQSKYDALQYIKELKIKYKK